MAKKIVERYTLGEIAGLTGAGLFADPKGVIKGISIDSRKLNKDEIFVAIRGKRFDGHQFIDEAIQKGASCVVVEKGYKINSDIDRLVVDNTIAWLGSLAKVILSDWSGKRVAITGSSGKTTTKEMLQHMLKAFTEVISNPGNFNNQIGLPLSIFQIKEDDKIAVLELGTNSKGEIRYLTSIIDPDVYGVTNVTCAHIGNFGSFESLLEEKLSGIDLLKEDSVVLLNERLKSQTSGYKKEIIFYGTDRSSEYRIDNIYQRGWDSRFRFNYKNRSVDVDLTLPGLHNIFNASFALAIVDLLGFELNDAAFRLKDFRGLSMRMERMKAGNLTLILDCYNANPDSTKAAIDTISKIYDPEEVILVLGDMLELGELSPVYHEEVGSHAAKLGFKVLLAVGPLSENTKNGFLKEGGDTAVWAEDVDRAGVLIEELLEGHKVVLLKASRALKLERLVDYIREVAGC